MSMEYTAYQGEALTIEWFFDEDGDSDALEFFNALSKSDKRKVLNLFRLLGDRGEIQNKEKFRNEGYKIFAFKPKPHRYLCFFTTGKKVIITNAFTKKSQKLPKTEKDRALARLKNYRSRVKKGKYYE